MVNGFVLHCSMALEYSVVNSAEAVSIKYEMSRRGPLGQDWQFSGSTT